MKKKKKKKIDLLELLLFLFVTLFIGTTLARFVSTFTGNGTATIAKWNILLKQDGTPVVSNNWTLNLADSKIANANVADNVIAPGDSGTFDINLSDVGTQVAYQYKIELDTSEFTTTTGNVKFYSDAGCTIPWSNINWTLVTLSEAGNQNLTKTICWKWEAGEANNVNDTTAGINTATLDFDVTVIAEQYTG